MTNLQTPIIPADYFNEIYLEDYFNRNIRKKKTKMTEHMYQNEELIERMAATYPLGLGTVEDIRDAVTFLLSDKARWITGQQLTVDGGRTINVTG